MKVKYIPRREYEQKVDELVSKIVQFIKERHKLLLAEKNIDLSVMTSQVRKTVAQQDINNLPFNKIRQEAEHQFLLFSITYSSNYAFRVPDEKQFVDAIDEFESKSIKNKTLEKANEAPVTKINKTRQLDNVLAFESVPATNSRKSKEIEAQVSNEKQVKPFDNAPNSSDVKNQKKKSKKTKKAKEEHHPIRHRNEGLAPSSSDFNQSSALEEQHEYFKNELVGKYKRKIERDVWGKIYEVDYQYYLVENEAKKELKAAYSKAVKSTLDKQQTDKENLKKQKELEEAEFVKSMKRQIDLQEEAELLKKKEMQKALLKEKEIRRNMIEGTLLTRGGKKEEKRKGRESQERHGAVAKNGGKDERRGGTD